jgi:hypothetical protein
MPLTDDNKTWLTHAVHMLIIESEQRTAQAIEASEQRTARAIERTETNVRSAFHRWARPVEQKLRTHREALEPLDLQIEEIASRVPKLEANFDTQH